MPAREGIPLRRASAVFAVVLAACSAQAATIHVPADYPTIREGIDAANAGDVVEIACGTYFEHDIDLKPGIAVRSESGKPDCVVIDGQQQDGIFFIHVLSQSVVLEGLTIQNGNRGGYRGGGVWAGSGDLEIRNCVFTLNRARTGGAVRVGSVNLLISDTTFQWNGASVAWGGGEGGGLSIVHGQAILSGCTFIGNQASRFGGGVEVTGTGTASFNDCVFSNNGAGSAGGAANVTGTSASFNRCLFDDNEVRTGGLGGAIQSSGILDVEACTFVNNSADTDGGGGALYLSGSATVANSLIAFNGAGGSLGCTYTPALSCCNIFGNGGGDWTACIADQLGLSGNFAADPLFCDVGAGDFHISASSPCAPENSPPGCGLIGAFPVGCAGVTSATVTWTSASWARVKARYRQAYRSRTIFRLSRSVPDRSTDQ